MNPDFNKQYGEEYYTFRRFESFNGEPVYEVIDTRTSTIVLLISAKYFSLDFQKELLLRFTEHRLLPLDLL